MTNKTYQTTLLIRGDSKNAVRSVQLTREELEKLTGSQKRNAPLTEKMSGAWNKADKSVRKASQSLSTIQGVIAALGLGKLISETIQAADSYASLQGQLKLVTSSQEELNRVYDRSLALANATGQSTEATVKLYARLARSTEELNLSQDELFRITEAVNQSFIVSGASATEVQSAVLQLSQGLASGALRGEELNSVMENSPRLARAIADGLGVTIGSLRDMGSEGELTGEKITTALLKSADAINSEFQEMPMTIGRVWQTLTNDVNDALGQVDTGPLIDSVEDLRAVIADPQFKNAITGLAGALLDLTGNAASALAGMVEFTRFIAEEVAATVHGIAIDDIPRLEGALFDLQEKLAFFEKNGHSSSLGVKALREEIAELENKLKVARSFQEDMNKTTIKQRDVTDDAADAIEELTEVTVTATRWAGELEKANQSLIAGLEEEIELLGMGDRQRAITVAQRRLNATATQEERDRVAELSGALWDASVAEEALAEITVKATRKTTTAHEIAAQRTKDVWDDAMQAMVERVDSDFASTWRQALDGNLDSFKDFGKSLLDSAKQLFAELLHLNITRPLVNGVAGMFGLSSMPSFAGGTGGGAGGIGSGGSVLSSLSSLPSMFGNGLANAGSSLFNMVGEGASMLGNLGIPGMNEFSTRAFQAGMTATPLSIGAGVVGGLAGGYLGNKVFGDTSGIGSAAGGIAGQILIPIPGLGAAIGSFLGSGIESLFGGTSRSDRTALDVDFATGAVTRGRSRGHDMDEAASQVTDMLLAFSQGIGGSTASFSVRAHGEHGFGFDGEGGGRRQFASADEFIAAAFDRIIDGAEQLEPEIKQLAKAFEGTAEETANYVQSLASISALIQDNPVDQALADYADSQEDAGKTLVESYADQLDELYKLIDGYDGSAQATSELNAALVQSKVSAYEFVTAIKAISEQIADSFGDNADYFRNSVLDVVDTPTLEQLKAEKSETFAALKEAADPDEIARLALRWNELTREIFDELPDSSQDRIAETFAKQVEFVEALTQKKLDDIVESIGDDQADINLRVGQMLDAAAQKQKEAADAQMDAAQEFGYWVEQLSRAGAGGLPAPSTFRGSEVV